MMELLQLIATNHHLPINWTSVQSSPPPLHRQSIISLSFRQNHHNHHHQQFGISTQSTWANQICNLFLTPCLYPVPKVRLQAMDRLSCNNLHRLAIKSTNILTVSGMWFLHPTILGDVEEYLVGEGVERSIGLTIIDEGTVGWAEGRLMVISYNLQHIRTAIPQCKQGNN